MGKPLFSTAQFLAAIPNSGGIFTIIAQRVGCDRHTATRRIAENQTLRRAWEDECETVGDIAEDKLIDAIKGGDLGAIKFYLSTKAKKRGYSERTEVTGKNGAANTFTVQIVRDEPDTRQAQTELQQFHDS
jgi:hypothetical protein